MRHATVTTPLADSRYSALNATAMEFGHFHNPLHYVSTRGNASALPFDDVVLAGLARDGGLYMPESWPTLSHDQLRALRRLSYPELAARILALFAEPVISEAELAVLAEDAYRGFQGYPDIAPLKPLRAGEWLLELFHGPTLAFKDYPLQLLGRLFDLMLGAPGRAHHRRSAPPRATPARRRSRPAATARPSTSSSCIREVASRRCSDGR